MTDKLYQGPVPVEPKEPNYEELAKTVPKSKLCDHEIMQILIDRERSAQDKKLVDEVLSKVKLDYINSQYKYYGDYKRYYGTDEG